MKGNLPKFIIGLLSMIASAFIGVQFKTWQDKKAKQTKYFDVKVDSNNKLIGRPQNLEKKVDILFDGKPIDNLTQIGIEVFNATDDNFYDVPIFIEMIPDNNDSIKIIRSEIYGIDRMPEAVSVLDKVTPSLTSGGLRFGYNISNASIRNDKPIFSAIYLILGSINPKWNISINKGNLDVREYKWNNVVKLKFWETDTFFWGTLILFYAVFIFIMVKVTRWQQNKEDKKMKEYFQKELSQQEQKGILPSDSEKLSETFIDLKKNFYKKKSGIFKLFNQNNN